jgi:hypothetical protein
MSATSRPLDRTEDIMSVTFAPNNNVRYCTERNLATFDEFECEVYPFELNITNDNAKNLAEVLGLELEGEYGTVGQIHPRAILKAIEALPTAMLGEMVRVAADPMDGGAGTEVHHLQHYLRTLKAVAIEAERREEPVVWA